MNKPLIKAIDIFGGQTKLAKAISKATKRKIVQSHIYTWAHRNKNGLPAELCVVVEGLTGVPKEQLRPDVYQSNGGR